MMLTAGIVSDEGNQYLLDSGWCDGGGSVLSANAGAGGGFAADGNGATAATAGAAAACVRARQDPA